MKEDYIVMYGRVKPVVQHHHTKKRGTTPSFHVTVVFTLPDGKPPYCYGKHLLVQCENEEYRIYNPQALRFDFNQLMQVVYGYARAVDSKILSVEVVE